MYARECRPTRCWRSQGVREGRCMLTYSISHMHTNTGQRAAGGVQEVGQRPQARAQNVARRRVAPRHAHRRLGHCIVSAYFPHTFRLFQVRGSQPRAHKRFTLVCPPGQDSDPRTAGTCHSRWHGPRYTDCDFRLGLCPSSCPRNWGNV